MIIPLLALSVVMLFVIEIPDNLLVIVITHNNFTIWIVEISIYQLVI
jgi:hypothetical protein